MTEISPPTASPRRRPTACAALFLPAAFVATALVPSAAPAVVPAPVVSAVAASVGPGSDIVVAYQLDALSAQRVELQYSLNGSGCFQAVPAGQLAGDAGPAVPPTTSNGLPSPPPAPRRLVWRDGVRTLGPAALGAGAVFRVLAQPDGAGPTVQFDATDSTASEGAKTLHIPVTFSTFRTGTLRYHAVAGLSNAMPGVDYTMPGSIAVSGTTATLPVTLIDDFSITATRSLILELEPDADSGTSVGARFRHSIVLFDNDAYWNGAMATSGGGVSFHMRLCKKGAQYQAAISSKGAVGALKSADGTGTLPPAPGPDFEYPLTVTAGPARFEAATGALPVGRTDLFGGGSYFRMITFTADNATTGSRFDPSDDAFAMTGTVTDKVSGSGPLASYLGTQTPGIFVMTRDLPADPTVTIPTQPAPAGAPPPPARRRWLAGGARPAAAASAAAAIIPAPAGPETDR